MSDRLRLRVCQQSTQSFLGDETEGGRHGAGDVPLESFRHSLAISGVVASRIISAVVEGKRDG